MPTDDLHGRQRPSTGPVPVPGRRHEGRSGGAVRYLGRQWRLLWPSTRGLVRGSDRVEAGALLTTLLLVVLLVPLLAGLGLAVDRHLVADAARQSAGGRSVGAVLLQDAPPVALGGTGEMVAASARALARWHLPGGAVRDGLVPVSRGTRAGTTVEVWLDAAGWPAPRPLSTTRAAAIGTLVGIGGWLTLVVSLGLAFLAVRQGLDRHRYRLWEREWALLDRPRGPGGRPGP